MRHVALLLATLMSASLAEAADPDAPIVDRPPPAVTVPQLPPAVSTALPSMHFSAFIASDELYARVHASAAFSRIEKDLVGSPIQLRVTHSLQPTAGGQATGVLSAIVAGTTLGLLPVVTNNNLVLTYEILVNGKTVLRYEYQRAFTRAVNMWAERSDKTYGLGEDGLKWALSTADEFVSKAAQDPALRALADEYAFYFGQESS